MNDKELADKVVALGVLRAVDGDDAHGRYYNMEIMDPLERADTVVRDWRVAGALMEKCYNLHLDWDDVSWNVMATAFPPSQGKHSMDGYETRDMTLPRAICEACVEALGD